MLLSAVLLLFPALALAQNSTIGGRNPEMVKLIQDAYMEKYNNETR